MHLFQIDGPDLAIVVMDDRRIPVLADERRSYERLQGAGIEAPSVTVPEGAVQNVPLRSRNVKSSVSRTFLLSVSNSTRGATGIDRTATRSALWLPGQATIRQKSKRVQALQRGAVSAPRCASPRSAQLNVMAAQLFPASLRRSDRGFAIGHLRACSALHRAQASRRKA